MLIDGVRIRWSVTRAPQEIVCTFSVGEACARYSVPYAVKKGVGARVIELIDVLVNSGVLAPEARAVAIGTARYRFLELGCLWGEAS